ncbi:phage repressor protein [Pantoea sp. FN060301]|uniref:phage repressor protein n=1 Tax=Pantoea sp. FN060301 TaxID=3420380 RepID=UPI003D17863A
MGFPSPAADYVERRLCLNQLFLHHPAASRLIEFGGLIYLVDAAIKPVNGDYIAYELFGEQGIGRLMGNAIITPDGEAFEGEALSEVVVMGCVTLTIKPLFDDSRPTV